MWYLSGFCLLVSYLIFWNLKFSSWFPIKSGKIFRGNLAILEQFHEISHENHYSDFIYLIWKRAKAERSEREGTGRDRMQGRDGRVKSRGVRKWDNLMFKTSEINDVKSGYARRDIMKHNSRKKRGKKSHFSCCVRVEEGGLRGRCVTRHLFIREWLLVISVVSFQLVKMQAHDRW